MIQEDIAHRSSSATRDVDEMEDNQGQVHMANPAQEKQFAEHPMVESASATGAGEGADGKSSSAKALMSANSLWAHLQNYMYEESEHAPAEKQQQLPVSPLDLAGSLPEAYESVDIPEDHEGDSRLGKCWRKFSAFAGPGYMVAVGYMDPGNWATDLAGGALFQYSLLFVVLCSSLIAIFLQVGDIQRPLSHK